MKNVNIVAPSFLCFFYKVTLGQRFLESAKHFIVNILVSQEAVDLLGRFE